MPVVTCVMFFYKYLLDLISLGRSIGLYGV